MTDGEKSSATGDVVPSGKENSPLSEKIATASAEVNTEPTEAQKEAGNYKKGHVQVGTFDITIEQPQGSVRKGTDADGKQWESKMNNTYGYIRGAVGVDGDHIDVFLSNDIDGWNGRKVFVVDQYNPDGSFDEHKVMLGFNDADEAKSDYLANYENGWENGRRIDVTAVNLEDFEKWIASSKRKTKPFGDYSSVKNGVVPSGEGDTPLLDVDGKPIVVKADDGKVELNLRTWQDEKQQVRDALLDGGLEPEAVDAMMAQAETIASGMSGLADKYPLFGAWQKVAATNRPILRNNAGGYLSFDYSFNCVKKDALNAVMEALVAEGKGGHLGVTQVEALKKVLQKHGFLTPCVMCYVEAKRKVYKQSKEMAAKWNAVAEAAGLTGEEMGAERELGAEQRNALAQLANGENLGSVKGYAENGKYGIKKDTIVKIAKLMLDSAKLRGRMNYEWMMSPSSYTEMYNKFGDTGLMEFMSQGQSRGKALLETSPFSFKSVPKDLMMGMYNPVVLANIGGVRQFSYEDARAVMFFDYYTQFLVMQGARAPEHLYTKRPFMPEMFGRTGAMMNQSLIVDIWRGEEWHKKALGLSDKEYDAWLTAHAGFVPRGALPKGHTLYEAGSTELVPNWGVESFPVDIAMKNVHNKDYKGTVGNVVVAPNRKFILWALDNPDIHMVLAYHANGANPLVKSLTGYDRAEAMDDGYHTHDENGKVVDELSVPEIGLEIHDGDLQWNVLLRRNGYDARKAAQVYLDYCKEHGLTPMFCYDGVVDMSGERATSHPEYYKLLTDFRVYDEDGNSIRQRAVKALLPENWQVILDKYLQQESALGSKVGHIGLDEGLMKEINAVTRFASIESGERDTLTKLLTSIYGKDNVQVLATREFDAALDEVTERGHAQMLRDNGGTVYGFAVGDRIVLNENLFNANTPMHEHTHVYMKVLKATNPRLYNRGMELWRDTPLWKQAKRGLEELGEEPTDEQIFSECMSQFTGAENEKVISEVTGITDKNWLQKAMSWLSEMWKGVKSAFSRWTQNDLDGLTAEQFGRMPLRAVYDAKERKAYAKRVKQVFGNGGAGEHGVEMMHEPSREETILRDVVIEHMKGSGLDVIGTEEGQRVLDMANGRYVRLEAKQKRALETATIAEQSTNNATVVSSADGAKVQKVLETLADNYEKRPNKTRGFITDLSRSLGLVQHEASQYGTFETRNGKLVTIRVSNHNARVSFFDENGEEDGISIVISSHKNKGVLNDGKAHLVEYFYPKQSLERSGGKPLADIVKCVSTVLESGKFEDTTGLAQRQEVNAQQIREHRVYHGSGAEFDHFDHSHMSEGEGSQVYGWGTYVTEVKGIAEGYAIRARNGISNINEEWYLKRGELESNIYRAKEQLPFLKGEYKAEMEAQISEWEKQLKEYDGPNNLYTVEIPGDNGSNYLVWNEPLSVEDSGRIISGLFDLLPSDIEEMAKRDYTFKHILYDLIKINDKAQFVPVLAKGNVLSRSTMYDGGREINDFGGVYRRLQGWFGSAKAVSKFLYSLGYAGIKYPADYRSGGREDNAKNYVIFNENDAEITDHVRFFKTKNGEAYGFTVGGKIYYDPRIANAETPVHEYAHLWASALKANNAKEWKNVVDLMKGTNVWEEVKKTYPELETDDEIADEVLATYSGRRGAERLREEMRKAAAEGDGVMGKAEAVSALQRVKRAIDKFWKAVADFLHIHYTSAEEVADRVMKDLLDGVDPRSMMDGGKSLRPETRVNVVEAEAGHGFKNYAEAKAWAKEHIARTYSGEETGGKGDIRISNAAVDKYLSQSAVDKSESKDVHLAVLKVLPDVIRESVDAEQHADFKKGEDGVRSAANGVNPNVTIHRLYGAVRMDGKLYRVKVTLKEDVKSERSAKKAYSYEATKIELLAGTLVKPEGDDPNTNNSITAANLLNGVEKSYDGGKFFEDYNKIREQFIGEKGAAAADHADEVNTRLDNLSVAREMEAEKKDAKAIKMATGWERGADGKWRYEIPDMKEFDRNGNLLYRKNHPDYARYIELLDKEDANLFEDGEALTVEERAEFETLSKKYESDKFGGEKLDNNHRLEAYVDAPELFKAYPELKNVGLRFEDTGGNEIASYHLISSVFDFDGEDFGDIVVNTGKVSAYTPTKELKSCILHEMQHAIQWIEGFARGGNPKSMQKRFEAAKEEWRARAWADALRDKADEMGEHYNQVAVEKALIEEYKEMGMDNDEWMPNKEIRMKGFNYFARGYSDRSKDSDIKNFRLAESTRADFNPYVEYTKLGGEVESRNVEARMGMTAEERRASLAAETEDVSREDQIFLMSGDGGRSYSLKDGSFLRSGSYFSGGGLLEEGLKDYLDPKVAVEFNEKISGVYRDNFGNHIVTADVRDVDPKELVKDIDGPVQYFHASPVCKNFSTAKRDGGEVELDKETARSTAQFIGETRPKVVTIENVKGYKNSDALKIITDELTAQGYDWDMGVYNAADYGGYTNRERLIVRAVRDGKLPPKPEALPEGERKGGWIEAVSDLMEGLPEKKSGVPKWVDERLKGEGIDYRHIDKPLYVFGQGNSRTSIPHAFADELLPTLRTKGGDMIIMPDGRVLKVTPRVLARVTGLADDYEMPATDDLAHTVVGNGIPTQLSEHVIGPLLADVFNGGEPARKDGSAHLGRGNGAGEMGAAEDYTAFASRYGVSEDMVKDYALGMKTGNLQKANFALTEIRRTMRVANRGMKLSEFGKLFRPVQKELAERYGDIEVLRQEYIDAEMRERGVMEAARKRAEEEASKRKARADELRLLPEEELDRRYFEAVERGDDAAAREMLDEAARRKGYGDTESEYQGVGAWVAPSNPGYESDAARRADVEDNAPDVNVEDIALGYSLVDENYWHEPRKYMQTDATAVESVNAINDAMAAIRRGEKDVKVKVYRAVPSSVKEGKLRNGDWVTPSRAYAKMHGEHRLGGDYRIIEDEVPVNELWWDGNDSREWGFDDGNGYKYKNVENSRKLNDLVTRDDNGEIIAPSKRFDENVEDVRYRTSEELDQINQKFNERLDELVSNPNQKDKVLHLGRSSEFLKDGGVSEAEIVLDYDKLVRKSKEGYKHEHPFDISDVRDLPIAIAYPIAVFDNTNGKNDGKVILTELKKDGRNFIVAIQTANLNRKGGKVLEVNKIVTLFPKDARGVVNWFNTGKATNIDKKKALHFIEALLNHSETTITNEELLSAANVVKDFETLQLSASEKAKHQAANDLARQMHVEGEVEVVTSTDGLTGRQAKAKGWYDVRTGKVTIVLPNNKNAADVRETVFHEVVAHKGLRNLVGEEHFNTFLDNVYNNAEEGIKQTIDEMAEKKYNGDKRKATEEYMAHLAEDGEYVKPENQGFFAKVRNFLTDLLRKVGIKLGFKLTDNDLRYILWRSWKGLAERDGGSVFEKAEDVKMQHELGQTDEARSASGENGIMFREGSDELKDVVEKMKADVERLHEGELDDLRSSARAIGGRLSELNKAMRLQRAYDMSTVASVTELAKTMLKNGLLSEMSDYDVRRLLSVVNNVHGKGDIRPYVQKVVDMMVGNRLRNVSKAFDKLLAMRGKKVDARGVEVQGELDLAGQHMADVVWKGIGMSDDDVADMCADAQDRMMSANGAEAAAAATDYAGWQIVMHLGLLLYYNNLLAEYLASYTNTLQLIDYQYFT